MTRFVKLNAWEKHQGCIALNCDAIMALLSQGHVPSATMIVMADESKYLVRGTVEENLENIQLATE